MERSTAHRRGNSTSQSLASGAFATAGAVPWMLAAAAGLEPEQPGSAKASPTLPLGIAPVQ